MGNKIWIIIASVAAVIAVTLTTIGIMANTKRARTKRFCKKAGMIMYTIGSVMRTISCQVMDA